MRNLSVAVLIGVLAFTVFGCGKHEAEGIGTVVGDELDKAPEWVLKGHGEEDGKIYGVGSVAGTQNIALARSAAQGRGRTEIARSLQSTIEAMLKDYQATTTGGEEFGTAVADEQHIVDASKQMADMTISGTRQEDTWISKEGALYILMSLDVEHFKETVRKMDNLSETIRSAVIERAEKAFEELAAETE